MNLFGEETAKHDPGGKSMRSLPLGVRGSAVFGGLNNEYRYRLERVWDENLPTVLFVMMNPSTASPDMDDPTVAKCHAYARKWGYGRLLVGNTFGYRATNQLDLCKVLDPVGQENTSHLLTMAEEAEKIVFAYGIPHQQVRRLGLVSAEWVYTRYPEKAHFLQLCQDGTPSHPLYLKGTLVPTLWKRG